MEKIQSFSQILDMFITKVMAFTQEKNLVFLALEYANQGILEDYLIKKKRIPAAASKNLSELD